MWRVEVAMSRTRVSEPQGSNEEAEGEGGCNAAAELPVHEPADAKRRGTGYSDATVEQAVVVGASRG